MKQYIQLNKEKFFQVPTNKNTYYRCTFTCSMSSISVDRFAIPKAKHSIPCFSNAKANQWPYQHHIEKVLPTRSNAKSTCGFSLKLYTNITNYVEIIASPLLNSHLKQHYEKPDEKNHNQPLLYSISLLTRTQYENSQSVKNITINLEIQLTKLTTIVFSIHRWNWTIEKAETPAFQIFHAWKCTYIHIKKLSKIKLSYGLSFSLGQFIKHLMKFATPIFLRKNWIRNQSDSSSPQILLVILLAAELKFLSKK